MKTFFAIVLMALLMQDTFSTRLRAKSSADLPAMQKIEQNKWGSQLLDTIALQLENKAPMDKIFAVIGEIISGLEAQQKEEDTLNAKKQAWCEDENTRLDTIIEDASNAIDIAEGQIVRLTKEIRQGEKKQSVLENNISILKSEISDTKTKRQKDSDNFKKRQVETSSAITAIEDAVEIVQQLVKDGPVDPTAAIEKLAKIGRSNPILAFAQVASTADQETVGKLIRLLNGLKDSMQASLDQDAVDEEESIAAEIELLSNLGANMSQAENDLSETLAELKRDRADLVTQQTELAAQESIKSNAEEELSAVNEECQLARETYADNTAGRSEELDIAQQVQQMLQDKFGQMSSYLSDRLTA